MGDVVKYEDSFEKFASFINNLSSQDNIALLHDTDPDGFTAATMVIKGLEKRNLKLAVSIPKDHKRRSVNDELLQKVKQYSVNKLIVVDLPFESYENVEALSDIDVLVLDHHQITATKTPQNCIIIKPHFFQQEIPDHQFPASYLTFILFDKLVGLQEFDWLAAIGILGDRSFPSHKHFIASVFARLGLGMTEDIYDSLLGEIVMFIAFGDASGKPEDHTAVLHALLDAKSPLELLSKLQMFAPIKKEIEKFVNEFPKKREVHGDLSFYEVTSEYQITSMVSTLISVKQVPSDNATILIGTNAKEPEKCNISARRQDCKVNMGRLMQLATQDLEDANGGGHIPAAGGSIRRTDIATFKKNVLALYESLKEGSDE